MHGVIMNNNKSRHIIDNNNSKLAFNIFGSGTLKLIAFAINYAYIPIVLKYLGYERFGVWSVVLTIISWVSFFDIGIGNGLINTLVKSITSRDGKSRTIISSSYFILFIILTPLAFLVIIISKVIDLGSIFGITIAGENINNVLVLCILSLICVTFLSLNKNILLAIQKAYLVGVIELIIQIINLLGILIAYKIGYSSILSVAVIYCVSMLLVNLIAFILLNFAKEEVRVSIGYVDYRTGYSIFKIGLQFLIIQLCGIILFSTDNVIISNLYGPSEVTPYTIVNKVFTAVINIYSAFLTPIWAITSKYKSEKSVGKIKELIRKMNLLMFPFFVLAIILMLVFNTVTNLWLGREIDYGKSLVICGLVYCILRIWSSTYAYIANGYGLIRESMILAIIQATINIPLSLFFAVSLGLKCTGVFMGTLISMFIGAVIIYFLVIKGINRCEQLSE